MFSLPKGSFLLVTLHLVSKLTSKTFLFALARRSNPHKSSTPYHQPIFRTLANTARRPIVPSSDRYLKAAFSFSPLPLPLSNSLGANAPCSLVSPLSLPITSTCFSRTAERRQVVLSVVSSYYYYIVVLGFRDRRRILSDWSLPHNAAPNSGGWNSRAEWRVRKKRSVWERFADRNGCRLAFFVG